MTDYVSVSGACEKQFPVSSCGHFSGFALELDIYDQFNILFPVIIRVYMLKSTP